MAPENANAHARSFRIGAAVRVMFVDAQPLMTELLTAALAREGWRGTTVFTGAEAVAAAAAFHPHLAVLETRLPDTTGLKLMRRLRDQQPDLPVLFLSVVDDIETRVAALAAGGDDYLTKPFAVAELISRLRALFRRSHATAPPASTLAVADLVLDESRHLVHRGGQSITLTVTEFELLRYFLRNAGRLLPREQILERVWRFDADRDSKLVELYVAQLRRKIDRGRPPLIRTVRSIGYILDASSPADAD
jgi:two-component system OmpR family response regulator